MGICTPTGKNKSSDLIKLRFFLLICTKEKLENQPKISGLVISDYEILLVLAENLSS